MAPKGKPKGVAKAKAVSAKPKVVVSKARVEPVAEKEAAPPDAYDPNLDTQPMLHGTLCP